MPEVYLNSRAPIHLTGSFPRTLSSAGYWLVRIDGKQMLEHRYIMSVAIGRALLRCEQVHHKDRNRQNNSIDNLELCANNAEHISHHRTEHTLTHKICTYCGEFKSLDEYHKHPTSLDGRLTQCIKCKSYLRNCQKQGITPTEPAFKRVMNGKNVFKCAFCNSEFLDYDPNRKYCSHSCRAKCMAGTNSPLFKGGCISSSGYHVFRSNGKEQKMHRFVMEQHLSRPLLSSEHIHHRDGNRLNNDISNLEICTRSEHAKKQFKGFRSPTHKQCFACRVIQNRGSFAKTEPSTIRRSPGADVNKSNCRECVARGRRLKNATKS